MVHDMTTDSASYPAVFYCQNPGCDYSYIEDFAPLSTPAQPTFGKEDKIAEEIVKYALDLLGVWDVYVDGYRFVFEELYWMKEVTDFIEPELEDLFNRKVMKI